MWQDDDFDTIGLYPHCVSLDVAPEEEVVRRTTRVSCTLIEDWKDKIVVPTKSITQVPATPFLGLLRFLIPLNAYLLLFV